MLKMLGVIMVLTGGFGLRRSLLAERQADILLGDELCRGLDFLEQGIFRLRLPLPELLRSCAKRSAASAWLWQAVAEGMTEEQDFRQAWHSAVQRLPPPYRGPLHSLYPVLIEGERRDLLLLTREELYRAVGEKRRQRKEEDRLITALCFSAAGLLAVVLL